jgi:hypothetical protein
MNAPLIDPMLRNLGRLPAAEPDAIHSASVRAQCHAALGRRLRAKIRRTGGAPLGRPYGMAVVGGFTLGYLLLVIYDALSVYGIV